MNRDILFEYIARRVHTHVRLCDQDLTLLHLYTTRKDLEDFFPGSEQYIEKMFQPVDEPRMLVINHLLTYMVIPVDDSYCLIGPTGACSDCLTQLQLPDLVIPEKLVQNIYKDDSNRLLRTGVFLYNLFAETPIDELECFNRNCGSGMIQEESMQDAVRSIFYHEEYGEKHNPYEAEVREMSAIEQGGYPPASGKLEGGFQRKYGKSFNGSDARCQVPVHC